MKWLGAMQVELQEFKRNKDGINPSSGRSFRHKEKVTTHI